MYRGVCEMSTPNYLAHDLPLIDLSNSNRAATAKSICQACVEHGYFYLINHGIDNAAIHTLLQESKKFFDLPLSEKMKLERDGNHRGYTCAEILDAASRAKGDTKESFYVGSTKDDLNKWPSEAILPACRETMELYYEKIMNVGIRVVSLIALALNLDETFFNKIGAMDSPVGFLRMLHYPAGETSESDKGNYGTSAHSDYGIITLLVADDVAGLQICKEKDRHPKLWEDVQHVDGALIVLIGDMLERWTNCTFRSTLHQVVVVGQERYSAAFFLDPNHECVVECLESYCNETSPARFPPIKSGDYFRGRWKLTYGY